MLSDQLNKLNVNHRNLDYQRDINPSQSKTVVEFDLIINSLDVFFLEKYDRSLNTVERSILQGIWQRKTYSEIAQENNYSADYFSNVAAPKLLKQLSQLVEHRITKKTCRSVVTKYVTQSISHNPLNHRNKRPSKTSQNMRCSKKNRFSSHNSLFDFSFLEDAISLVQII